MIAPTVGAGAAGAASGAAGGGCIASVVCVGVVVGAVVIVGTIYCVLECFDGPGSSTPEPAPVEPSRPSPNPVVEPGGASGGGGGSVGIAAPSNGDCQSPSESDDELGPYGKVGGHHIHAQAAFRGSAGYSSSSALAMSQEYMRRCGINHRKITNRQRELFRELARSERSNTMAEHTRIATESLQASDASGPLARALARLSEQNLTTSGVTGPSNIPWYG